jgi:iron complex outermembrane recepter protein
MKRIKSLKRKRSAFGNSWPKLQKIVSLGCALGIISLGNVMKVRAESPAPKRSGTVVVSQPADVRTISGVIADLGGSPLPGVAVMLKGTTIGTTSDASGKYTLSKVPDGSELVFSCVGMTSKTIKVGSQTQIDVTLEDASTGLNEVVVTALGIKKEQRALGYAVSTVSAADLTKTGSTNFGSALYGKAAGVRINSAPGGATSAVNIQIRGVTSINNNTQPLYIVDGVPIRSSTMLSSIGGNNGDYWSETKIRENGAIDINPEDIETLSILKGASASALYGSEAANGVIVITTKKGSKNRGLGVDIGYSYNFENVATKPDYQNEYGPGYDRATNVDSFGSSDTGWLTDDDGSVHPIYRAYAQFGPKFDGRTVKYWDGSSRSYVANKDNYKDFYQTGYSSISNVAISNASDNGNFRLAYTRTDYEGIQRGGNMQKNNFSFNGTLKLNKNVSVDIISNYINTFTHNRPTMLSRLTGAFGGFYSRMDDMNTYLSKYQTTKGYKYVKSTATTYDPDEALSYNIRAYELLDLLWSRLKNSYDESQNRYINSVTANIALNDKFKLRGRIGNDFTSLRVEDKQHNEYSSAFGYSGYYKVANGRSTILYGDALLSYNTNNILKDLGLTASIGANGKRATYSDASSNTNDGLVIENWFSLTNSASSISSTSTSTYQSDMAAFGILGLNYKSWLYMEATGRNEWTSTLPKNENHYFYPSINSGFVFSDAFKFPSYLTYGKLRASWGIVGNHPEMYQAGVAYTVSSVTTTSGNVIYQSPASSQYGNDGIRSEKKYESEIGLELKFLQNRLGFDFSYYYNKIKDQILYLDTPASSGASSMLTNVGDLSNQGLEISISATPLKLKSFEWTSRLNIGMNRNKLLRLTTGVDELIPYSTDGGALQIKASVGDALGNIYVHPISTNSDGVKIVNSDGYYEIDNTTYQKVGNITPKVVGGFSNTFTYKNFALDIMIDYRLGGQIVSTPTLYMTGAGMYKNSLQYRDAEHGGLSYYIDDSGTKVASTSGTYNDGLILSGVTESGDANTTIIDAASYYLNSFGWGAGSGYYNQYDHAVFDNSYIKLREMSLSYTLPKSLTKKMKFQNIQFSLTGRNLFFIWKTLDNIDPEATVGSSWLYQGIDQGAMAGTRSFGASLRASF